MRKTLFSLTFVISLIFTCSVFGQEQKTMESEFMNPDSKTQISAYWYWISGNVSAEGVAKDLYAMKQAGITRAYIGNIGLDTTETVRFYSDEWWKVLHSALKTASKLGIDIGIFNSPGWSQSGGPWIKPEQSMRYLTSVKAEVTGGRNVDLLLVKPDKSFQDVKVIAYPSVDARAKRLNNSNTTLTSQPALAGLDSLLDGNHQSALVFTKKYDQPINIDFHTGKPFTLRSLKVFATHKNIQGRARLLVKDGNTYRVLADEFLVNRYNSNPNVGFDPYAPIVISIPATTATDFRLELKNITEGVGIAETEFSSVPYIERYPEKTLAKMFQAPHPLWKEYQWRDQPIVDDLTLLINPDKVIDITSCLKGDHLEWNAPAGNWTILRTGMLTTGVTNAPAAPYARGLEADKMSRKHIEEHFESFLGEIYRRIPANDRKSWKVVVEDSYETGGQNFTDGFMDDFKARYGYDMLPFLPVFNGNVVLSQDASDRFLWDLRRLIADKVAYDYVGGLRDISHKYGLTTWLENYGHWGFPSEFLMYGGQSDEIGGEFWRTGTLGDIENRVASSCGHTYGKSKVSAESFTASGKPFDCFPSMMKQRGDRFFTEGINNTALHVYISQFDNDVEPGINADFNTEFNRKNTWFSQLDLFTTYLKRMNYMLQRGRYVADVAYFIGEDAPKMDGLVDPAIPKGYQYDFINAEVIERDLTVKDGILTLPCGTQYRILVLPKLQTMRPALLTKIKKLIEDGAVVLGPAPQRSPSFQNFGKADAEVKALADEMWKGLDGVNVKSVNIGKGTLIYGMNLTEALQKIDCQPDCKLAVSDTVLYCHQAEANQDIYMISNQKNEMIEVSPEFRVRSMQPELWNPVTGETRDLKAFTLTTTGTVVPLKLYPNESAFIVFRRSASTSGIGNIDTNYPAPTAFASITTPWKVSFDAKRRGPEAPVSFSSLKDISKDEDPAIKYYSGTIVYENDFNLKLLPKDCLLLNLNKVGVMAKVKVNGQYVGGVWTTPYRLDISKFVKKGSNHLEVEVVTTWRNRLIGDSNLPESQRKTWAKYNTYNPKDELQLSGLIGPVTLETLKY